MASVLKKKEQQINDKLDLLNLRTEEWNEVRQSSVEKEKSEISEGLKSGLLKEYKSYERIKNERDKMKDEIYALENLSEQLKSMKNHLDLPMDDPFFKSTLFLREVVYRIYFEIPFLDITFRYPYGGLREVLDSGRDQLPY